MTAAGGAHAPHVGIFLVIAPRGLGALEMEVSARHTAGPRLLRASVPLAGRELGLGTTKSEVFVFIHTSFAVQNITP